LATFWGVRSLINTGKLTRGHRASAGRGSVTTRVESPQHSQVYRDCAHHRALHRTHGVLREWQSEGISAGLSACAKCETSRCYYLGPMYVLSGLFVSHHLASQLGLLLVC
jgi:hypothetical protein